MKLQVKLPGLERRATGIYETAGEIKLGAPELRTEGAFPKIVGYAAIFNQPSQPLFMGVVERIRPGAFTRTLAQGADVRALVDHDPSKILGRNKAGTLRLSEDSHGLKYEIDPPDTSTGRDVMVSLRRGDLNQSSFGFRTKEEEYVKNGEVLMRELVDVDLFDVSIVAFPAYPQTSVEVRSLWPEAEQTMQQIESWFRCIEKALNPPPAMLQERERKLRLMRLTVLSQDEKARVASEKESRKVQSFVFDRRSWTAESAVVWLADHGFLSGQMTTGPNQLRFVQFDLALSENGSFLLSSEGLARGIKALSCRKKPN